MQLGKLIKYHRTRQGITQKELANGICSISYLSKIENGSITPNNDVIKLIANRLNISLHKSDDNVDEIKQRIYRWYEMFQNGNQEKIKEELDDLINICQATSNIEIKHFIAVMNFCYEITFNRHPGVDDYYKELKKAQNVFNDETLYYFLKFESFYFYYKDEISSALNSLIEAEKVYKRIEITDLSLYHNLSIFYKRTYQVFNSTIYAQRLLSEAQKLLNFKMITNAHLIIATNFIRIGEYNSAKEILKKLLNNEEDNTPRTNSLIYHNLGYIYYQLGSYDEALQNLNEALALQDDDLDKIETIYIICLVHYAREDFVALERDINKGNLLAKKHDVRKFLFKYYILNNKFNKTTLTEDFISELENKIIPYFEENGERDEVMKQLKLLGDILYEKRQYKKAAECYSQTHLLYVNTFRIEDFT